MELEKISKEKNYSKPKKVSKTSKNISTDTKKQNGITLIALVVTIIVLLILAGVSINIVLNNNGIFKKAQDAGVEMEKAALKERIETIIVNWKADEIIRGVTEERFWKDLEDAGIIENATATGNPDSTTTENGVKKDTYTIETTDDYEVEIIVTEDEKGNINITVGDIETSSSTTPKVSITELTSTETSITVKVSTKRMEVGTLTYSYREKGTTNWTEWTDTETSNTQTTKTEITITTGIVKNKTYEIKVIAQNNGENSRPATREISTGIIPSNYTWTQNKTTVTGTPKSGIGKTVTLTVGEEYDYTVTGVTDGYIGTWKVLGAGVSEEQGGVQGEEGKLLIMTDSNITTENLTLTGKEGYNTGISQMNTLCAQKCGTGARSVNVDDINRVTGYDPTNQGDGTVYGAGGWNEYGNVVTYTASGSSTTNEQTYTGNLQNKKYEHPDGRTIGVNESTDELSIIETCTDYRYYPYTLTIDSAIRGTCKGISTSSLAYVMIFGTYENTSTKQGKEYWLASSCVGTDSGCSYYNLRYIRSMGYVNATTTWNSIGAPLSQSNGVRAVIAL